MIPSLSQSNQFLTEAAASNPGPWVDHSRYVAQGARNIASRCPALDPEKAYILGLLHDIGRREGVTGNRHAVDGFRFLAGQGYAEAGRVCITHSFAIKNINSISGEWDGTPEDKAFVQSYLDSLEFDSYDRLIQLCDSLSLPAGFCLVEKRLVDVALRYGFNECTLEKWRAILAIKAEFDAMIGASIYSLLPGVIENSFNI